MLEIDRILIKDLSEKIKKGNRFARVKNIDSAIVKLQSGTSLRLNIEKHRWKDTDQETHRVTIARAASTGMWPMGTHFWVRDNAFIAARLLFSPFKSETLKKNAHKLGKAMLLSTLTLMSSNRQLERFRQIITAKNWTQVCDGHRWPHIFFSINENLNATKDEAWAHKQDAWQILAWYTLRALDEGLITIKDLSEKHLEFIGLILPFLAKIEFWHQENCGSWEELSAVRSSVMVWEIRLIEKLGILARTPGGNFINSRFKKFKSHIETESDSASDLAQELLKRGVDAISKMLPFESPGYPRSDARYRRADAALFYLLELDFPNWLGNYRSWPAPKIEKLEAAILKQILSLEDKATGAIRRYKKDSYQRLGFFRHQTVAGLSKLYGSPSGDASSHFSGRDKVVPKGREAAWSHFVWQLVAWSARRYQETGRLKYLTLSKQFLGRALRLVTVEDDWTLEQRANGKVHLFGLHSDLIPECWISEKYKGKTIILPSPHTPLNWAVAEASAGIAWWEAASTNRPSHGLSITRYKSHFL